MNFYIDYKYQCYTVNPDGAFREVEHSFFDGKCKTFIEGYRFIPSGESHIGEDGVEFYGEMIAPFKNYDELDASQREYERQLLTEYESALTEIEAALGV